MGVGQRAVLERIMIHTPLRSLRSRRPREEFPRFSRRTPRISGFRPRKTANCVWSTPDGTTLGHPRRAFDRILPGARSQIGRPSVTRNVGRRGVPIPPPLHVTRGPPGPGRRDLRPRSGVPPPPDAGLLEQPHAPPPLLVTSGGRGAYPAHRYTSRDVLLDPVDET